MTRVIAVGGSDGGISTALPAGELAPDTPTGRLAQGGVSGGQDVLELVEAEGTRPGRQLPVPSTVAGKLRPMSIRVG